jgi:formamidopyrimidine-DNA glycosylase
MPELPEVETVVRRLDRALRGRTVISAEALWARSIARPAADRFAAELEGRRIEKVGRRGKFIVATLSDGRSLLAHLRMSGDMLVVPAGTPMTPYVRVRIGFDEGLELRFDDTRKFGRMYLVDDPSIITGKLGVEPLGDEFTAPHLQELLAGRKGAIKPLLLNQELVAGIGNIYAVETLWRARIHPLRPAHRLKFQEIELLHRAIREVLAEAVSRMGTDIGDGVWKAGDYSPRVYGRAGKKCLRCKKEIARIVVGQRGTEFCPSCQKRR